MRHPFLILSCLALLSAIFLGCGFGDEERSEEARIEKSILAYSDGEEAESLDPAKTRGVTGHRLILGLFEGLTWPDPVDLKAKPGVAESWDVSNGGKTYTFHLRKNAIWSNGDPVTAEDFRWSWIRALDPKTAAEYAWIMYYVKGAQAFNKGQGPAEGVGVSAPDDHTLVVELENATPFFPDLVSFGFYMPVHRKTVEANPKKWAASPELWVSNGPFVLSDFRTGDKYVLTKNERWWNAETVSLNEIHSIISSDHMTLYNKYKNGELDWVTSVPVAVIDEAKTLPGYRDDEYLGTYYYRFNVTKKPFDDPRVRMALNLAIDKKTICEKVTRGGQVPATSFVPASMGKYTYYDPIDGLGHDPERARKLLADAGYPGGEGWPATELLYNTSESHKKVAEAIVDMWEKTLGIRISLANKEWKVYLAEVHDLKFQVARAGWIGDFVDPDNFLALFTSESDMSDTGWKNAEFDRLILAAQREADPEKRAELYRKAETILVVEDMPVLPIYYYVSNQLVAPHIKGFHGNLQNRHPFQFLSVGE